LTTYLKAVPGMIGLHALTFFSVEGIALGPSTVVAAWHKADQALLAHFSSNR
jgi:FMN-dependent NADH-azoreductase